MIKIFRNKRQNLIWKYKIVDLTFYDERYTKGMKP